MQPRVCVIILNYNGLHDTLECLESLRKDQFLAKEIVVVDNGSTDDSVATIRRNYGEVTLIENRDNLGFTGGNNVGLRYAETTGAKYLVWLNNDTTVEPDAIQHLVEAAENHPELGMLTPLISYFGGSREPWFAGSSLTLSQGVAVHDNSNPPLPGDPIRSVPWISGCAMFAAVHMLTELGGFDDRFFLYWEDVDLSLRIRNSNRDLALVPAAHVFHKVSRTASALPSASRYYYVRNNLLLTKLHRPAAGRWATWRVLLDRLREGIRESRNAADYLSLKYTMLAIFDYFRGRFGKRKL